ncbi:OOP, partial [Symbiodinium sp. KB8]
MQKVALKTVVFMGSARNVVPPWGGDARLGDRVLKHVLSVLKARDEAYGQDQVSHEVSVFDPVEVFGPGGACEGDGHLTTPHFFLKAGTNPKMDEMRDTIKAADGYVVVTAEYNHSLPPALTSLMGHFGGSNYKCKPSCIVTYSPGPWAGMRAAMAARPFLSELGCIPVSKLAAFPAPNELFDEEGAPKDPEARMLKQLPAMVGELEWMALAMKKMRDSDPSPDSIVDLARRRLTSQDLGHEVADNGLASFAGPFCTGFGAGEYAALWSEVLAADVFETFSKALPQELPELGWRFREAFLEPGAGRAPITAFQDFQGRVPK